MALVERRTAAAGGGQATVSNAAGVWTELTTAMTSAGWTVHKDLTSSAEWPAWTASTAYALGARVTNAGNRYMAFQAGTSSGTGPTTTTAQGDGSVQWEFMSTSTASDVIYTSTGESGNERIFARVQTYSTYLNILLAQYVDASGTMFNRVNVGREANFNPGGRVQNYNFSGATTINFAILADKDSVWGVAVTQANAKAVISFGNFKRSPKTNSTFFTTTSAATAGLNVTINVSGDPIAAGYLVDDPVMLLAQEASTTSFTIPACATKIVGLTTSSITVAEVKENTASGAFIGMEPMPYYFIWSGATSGNPGNTIGTYTGNVQNPQVTNLYSNSVNEIANPLGAWSNTIDVPLRNPAVSEMDPNNRTGYTLVTFQWIRSQSNQLRGYFDKFYHWHGTAHNQWTIKKPRYSPASDWLSIRDTVPSSGSEWILGPFTATTATVTFSTYDVDSDYLELDFPGFSKSALDRVKPLPIGGPDVRAYLPIDEFRTTDSRYDSNDYLVALNMAGNMGLLDRFSDPRSIRIEPFPFDSASATIGGSSNGFNSGFN